jgi:type IV pilus assembly protein PilC
VKTLPTMPTLSVPASKQRSAKAPERPATPPPPTGAAAQLRLSGKERFALLEQFATLVDSGIQVASALQGMRQQAAEPRVAAVLGALEQSVVAGLPLSAAMAALPRSFPPLLVQMVRAGEATGQLGDMLRRTVEGLEVDVQMRARLRSAMLYPAIMLSMTVAVVVFLLTCIVPKFESLLRGKQIPLPTQMLLAAGQFLGTHGHWLALGCAAIVVASVLALRTEPGRVWLDGAMLRTPGVAALCRTAILARCTRTLGLLLEAGVPLHQALEHTQEVAGSHSFRTLWHRARQKVVNGGALLDAVRGQPLLGGNFEQLVAAGEATATLDRVMLKVGQQQTKDLERRIRDLLTIVEPMMVLTMAAIVGFVALSIMMPIFKMSRG